MTTHTGTVTCARGWDEPAEIAPVPPSLDGSWEQLMHAAGLPRLYVGAASLRRALGERSERLQRAIGVVYRPEAEHHRHYHLSRLASEFDVIVHVDATRAASVAELAIGSSAPAATG
jgi:erythromycin esterase-like protein